MNIKWIITKEIDEIYFPEQFKEKHIGSSGNFIFHFGSWKKELSLQFTEDLPHDTIGLSENLKNDIFIPSDLVYEINITKDRVDVGPVILYVVSKRLIKRLAKLKRRFRKFSSLKGLIIVSTMNGINTENQTIKGYYLQPKTDTRKTTRWKKGVFSYPNVIFKRAPLSKKLNKHLYQKTNGRIFNSKYFNKWDMWKWLTPNREMRNHLPDTKELNSINDIHDMLALHSSLYLKPKNGSRGKGIIEIKHDDKLFKITDDKNRLTTADSLKRNPIIKKVLKKKKHYMIQQGVPIKHDTRNVDFRMYMQKDETKQWKCSGFIARFAKPGSITTNLHHLDYLLSGKEAFGKLFNLNQEEERLLEQKVITICTKACKLLDRHGCFADIALDFILDKDMHVWILEMNKRYGYKSLSLIQDSKLYSEIIRNPFLYANAISGFNSNRKVKKELVSNNSNNDENFRETTSANRQNLSN